MTTPTPKLRFPNERPQRIVFTPTGEILVEWFGNGDYYEAEIIGWLKIETMAKKQNAENCEHGEYHRGDVEIAE